MSNANPVVGEAAGDSALDRAVFSYTPTVRSLLHHRAQVAAQPATQGPDLGPNHETALVIALPATPGAEPLPDADDEADLLADELWSGALVLKNAAATRETVLAALTGRRRVHFAGHARSGTHPGDNAVLLLHDHQQAPLTVTDVAALHLTGADFVFLSACETTVPALALADEAVHLTGAFHLAGFHHVIGTLWRTSDDVARRVADSCHRSLMITGTGQSARALHQAMRAERRRSPMVPTLWAAHLHTGI